MLSTWPRRVIVDARAAVAGVILRRRPCSMPLGDRAQIGALHAQQHVERRRDVVVRDVGRAWCRGRVSARLPSSCVLSGVVSHRPATTGVFSSALIESISILRRLHEDAVVHAVLRIEPEVRRRLAAGLTARSADRWRRRAASRPSGSASVRSTFTRRSGVSRHLLQVHVDRAGNCGDIVGRICRRSATFLAALLHAGPTICTSIGAGKPKFSTCVDDVRRREEERQVGKLLRQLLAQLRACTRRSGRDLPSAR